MVWVETDYDADAIMALLPEAVVRGSMKPEVKEERLTPSRAARSACWSASHLLPALG